MKPMRALSLFGIVLLAGILSAQDSPQKGANADKKNGGGQVRMAKIAKIDRDKMTITLNVQGKDLDLIMTEKTQVLDAKGDNLKERLQGFKIGADVFFKAEQKDGRGYLFGIKLAGGGGKGRPPFVKVDSSKLVPLNQLGDKEYKDGFKGGFYPDGKNNRPKDHEAAGLRLAKDVQPLDADGKPHPQGKIVLLSVGMSNTAQASNGFQRVLKSADGVNPHVLFVNGAVGGMTASKIQNPDSVDGKQYWGEVDAFLKKAGVTRAQVQVVWIKEADGGPGQGFPGYAKKLEEELVRIVQLVPKRFPNVKLAYLSSRTYGGYATSPLNPEPYAYESAFSVKWLIERQIKGESGLSFAAGQGDVKAPWLSWGPYLWANGSSKRTDGFSYDKDDFTANDGTHLTPAGQEKVGRLMLRFFQTDTTTRSWFTAKAAGSE
jgi:Cu/Ag efflux protein CusF